MNETQNIYRVERHIIFVNNPNARANGMKGISTHIYTRRARVDHYFPLDLAHTAACFMINVFAPGRPVNDLRLLN